MRAGCARALAVDSIDGVDRWFDWPEAAIRRLNGQFVLVYAHPFIDLDDDERRTSPQSCSN